MEKTKALIKDHKSLLGKMLRQTPAASKDLITVYLLGISMLREVEASIHLDEMEAAYVPGPIEFDVPILADAAYAPESKTLEELDGAFEKSQKDPLK